MSYEQPWPAYPSPIYPYATAYPVRRSAPASVHIVSILQYIGGAVALAGAVLSVIFGEVVRRQPIDPNVEVFSAEGMALVMWILAGFLAFCGIVAIVLGRKAQRGRQWARVVLIVLNVLSILAVAYESVTDTFATGTRTLPGLILPVLYLILLNTRAARSWFRAHTY